MKKKVLIVVLVLFFAILAGGFVYINDYYHADEEALAVLPRDLRDITDVIVLDKEGMMVFLPRVGINDEGDLIENTAVGMIFYPGGKVEYIAYAPLLYRCAELGIASVLIEMPGNLAVLDMNAADGIIEQYPEVEHWYLAGHSLGGAMASSYLAEHKDLYEGIILLAAYSTESLHGEKVLSVYGSEDGVLDMEKYEDNRVNLPEDYIEMIIEGGCHAFFGSYGIQDGDGIPTITAEQQQEIAAQAIAEFVKNAR